MRKVILIVFCCLLGSMTYAQRIKILSYNIHHGSPPAHANKIDLEAIAKVIKDSDADLVGVQEVDVRVSRSGNVDQAAKLAELTGMDYFFCKGIDLEEGEYGTLILTKHKIVGKRRYDLPMVEESENRSLAIVDVELPDGKMVSFANTHLDLGEANKVAQAKYINELGDWYERPLILVGDLNAEPDDEPIKILETHFERNTTSNGPTFPNVNPRTEIDYIMVGKHSKFAWKSYQVLSEEYASDHRPLFTEIEIVE